MKILIIHTFYQIRGGEDAVFEQEVALLKHTHEVQVLNFYNQGGWRGALQFLSSLWNIRVAYKVKKAVKSFRPDVVHIHNLHFASGPLPIRLLHRLRIPIVVTLHNYRLLCPSATMLYQGRLLNDSLYTHFPWQAIRKKVYRNSFFQTFWLSFVNWFHRKIDTWQLVDKYIVLTDFAKELYLHSSLNLPAEKFVIKPNFTERPIKDIVQRGDHLLFVGRLSEEKGINTLLSAFTTIDRELHVAGDGFLLALVKSYAIKYPNICFLGRLTKEEVATQMKSCSALVFPSIWYEGMPMTIIEAFSVGTPVIASDLGAMSTMIQDGVSGFLFKAGDTDSLNKAIERLNGLSDDEYREMRYEAYGTYQKIYHPRNQKRYFEEIYNTVINNAKVNR